MSPKPAGKAAADVSESVAGVPAQAQWAAIIKEASRSLLGIVALACLVLGAVIVALFWTSGDGYKLAAFGAFLLAVMVFVLAVMKKRTQDTATSATTGADSEVVAADVSRAAPRQASMAALAKRAREWTELLLSIQRENGGLRTSVTETGRQAQVWSTAQGVVAVLAASRGRSFAAEDARKVRAAFEFIEKRRNAGGIEGWGLWDDPPSPAPCATVEAWIAVACVASLRADGLWTREQSDELRASIVKTLDHLVTFQDPPGGANGGWCPQTPVQAENTRTYPTIVALWAIVDAEQAGVASSAHMAAADRAIGWLLHHRVERAGWQENPNCVRPRTSYPSVTAQVLWVLARAAVSRPYLKRNPGLRAAKLEFLATAASLTERPMYDNEQMHGGDQTLYGTSILIEGSRFLWYPWALAALKALGDDDQLSADDRARADSLRGRLLAREAETDDLIAEGTWAVAETLHGLVVASGL